MASKDQLSVAAGDELVSSATSPSNMVANASNTFAVQDSPLLRLTGELRNRIYDHFFTEVCTGIYRRNACPKQFRPCLHFIQTCRQIRYEASPLLYTEYVTCLHGNVLHGADLPNLLERAGEVYSTASPHPVKTIVVLELAKTTGELLARVEALFNTIADQVTRQSDST